MNYVCSTGVPQKRTHVIRLTRIGGSHRGRLASAVWPFCLNSKDHISRTLVFGHATSLRSPHRSTHCRGFGKSTRKHGERTHTLSSRVRAPARGSALLATARQVRFSSEASEHRVLDVVFQISSIVDLQHCSKSLSLMIGHSQLPIVVPGQ